VVRIVVGFADETVESFGPSKQAALCASIVSVSGDPTAKCTVTSVEEAPGKRRRLLQTGITVTTDTVFSQSSSGPTELVDTLTNNPEELGGGSTVETITVEELPDIPPSPPRSPSASAGTGCTPSIIVSWQAPSGPAVDQYVVACQAGSSTLTKTVPATQTSHQFLVDAGTAYTCSVASKNAVGQSAAASAGSATYTYVLCSLQSLSADADS
jgi:hypothetical protein